MIWVSSSVVSIYLVPGRHGRSLGSAILAAGSLWLKAQHPEIHSITAEVKPLNSPSIHALIRAGFVEHGHQFKKQLS